MAADLVYRAAYEVTEVEGLEPQLERPALDLRDRDDLVNEGHQLVERGLELLQELNGSGTLVDWGAGSGVLAIAAARLGYAPVVAVEVDMAAAHVAKRNAGRNGEVVEVVVGDVTADAPWAPTIVANLTLPLLVAAAGVTVATAPTRLIASGVLASHTDEAVAAWAPLGFVERERRELDGWAALVLERAA